MNWDGTFWVVDLEGNGAKPPSMVELALVEVKALAATGLRRHWLVRSQEPISKFATSIHGIADDDLVGAPDFEDIAEDVLELIEGAAIVGHNVRVDFDVLARALPDWRPAAAIDTLKLAKAVKPGLPSYGLSNLAASLGLAVKMDDFRGEAHSAPYDAALAALLFARLLADVPMSERSRLIEEADVIAPAKGTLL